jgi:predicted nucleotide-binding protein (sugar kinase/HSP70/actin superfamily)
MKLTVPHLGHIDIFLNAMAAKIWPEFIFPPRTSSRTLLLGTKYSPESACLPFKLILGNFIEALEKGADTIAMITDHSPCRVGMYDVVMQQILRDLGFHFGWIAMDDTRILRDYLLRFNQERKKRGVSLLESLLAIRFSWKKVRLCEAVGKLAHQIRPLEVKKGETTRVQTDCMRWIDEASNIKELKEAHEQCLGKFNRIEKDTTRNPLKGRIKKIVRCASKPLPSGSLECFIGNLRFHLKCLFE